MSRFASPGRHKKEITAVLAIVVALGLGSMLALMVDCRVVSSIYYWDFPGHESFCPSPVRTSRHHGLIGIVADGSEQYTRWQVVVAFDVITEILILVVPVDLIWCLQMPSSRKVGIIVSFYIRIPVLAFSIARDYYVHNLMSASDTGLASRYVIIWQEVELTYSIAAATLMCLRPLIRDFDTGFGLGGETVRTHAASGYILSNGENSRTGGKLSKYGKGSIIQLSSRGKDKDNFSVTEAEVPRTRPKHESTTEVTASHDPQDHGGRGSTGRGADDILITHRVEQSVYPRNMV
ncbi:MAG: hypothetical protein LQ342_003857 [Letrouitia transgressa]|nr:MAG: hypothetical protein LQ342_003857 [Letrouitia transgressa]